MAFGNQSSGMVGEAFSRLDRVEQHLAAQTHILRAMLEQSHIEAESSEYYWLRTNGTANASGTLVLNLENRTGTELELISWSSVAGSTSSGGLTFFLNSTENPNLVWATPVTQYASDKFHSGMLVPVNGVLVAQFLNIGAAQQCWVNVFTKQAIKRVNAAYRSQPKGW